MFDKEYLLLLNLVKFKFFVRGKIMKQDIRFNGWVLISAIFQVIAGAACIGAGAVLAIMGIANANKLLGIKEVNFFINQQGLVKLQKNLFGNLLIEKYLFMIMGAIMAVIGIIALVFAIIELLYVKRYKVVNHRAALIAFALIPLAIAGCVEVYLLKEYDVLKSALDYIKNIRTGCFIICGIFSACAILKLLGVLFSKSEEFVSNDNNKYAFEGPKASRAAQGAQPRMQTRNQTNNQMQGARPVNRQNSNARPANVQLRPANVQSRPENVQPRPANTAARPIGRPASAQARPANVARPGVGPQTRPVARPGAAPAANAAALPSRPAQNSMSPRQMGAPNSQSRNVRPAQIKRCPKCGKALMPNETVCSVCGKTEKK